MEIEIAPQSVGIVVNGSEQTFIRASLPAAFLQWQSHARLHMFDLLSEQGGSAVRVQPAHLPALATFGDGIFPINLSTRGIGMLPDEAHLETVTACFEAVIKECAAQSWEESLPRRVQAAREFYQHPEWFDPMLLGGLEIFEGQTLENLRRDPRAALLYSGEAPRFPSYQFNGVVSLLEQGHPYYRFLLAARELFARDPFHIHQIQYPFGYVFLVVEIKEKTPYPRR